MDDLVRREDALMALTGEWTESRDELIAKAVRRIKKLPSVIPKQKTGYWAYFPFNPEDACCSKCLYVVDTTINDIEDYKFCPLCGAKMGG